jgi:hypothetical protein
VTSPHNAEDKTLTGSGFEKKGGYASPKTSLASLPKVPAGPAPGASSKSDQAEAPQSSGEQSAST